MRKGENKQPLPNRNYITDPEKLKKNIRKKGSSGKWKENYPRAVGKTKDQKQKEKKSQI